MRRLPFLSAVFVSLASTFHAHAYNPPTDTAGPLVVRIEGPELVTETETPLPVRVIVENRSDTKVDGTLQLRLIDGWRSDPAEAVRFSVDGRSTSTREFKVIAGRGTFSAHYPIHCLARFTSDGKPLVAHPVLVLRTKLPPRPRATGPVAWKPINVPAAGQLALWQVPAQRCVLRVFGEDALTMPDIFQHRILRTLGA